MWSSSAATDKQHQCIACLWWWQMFWFITACRSKMVWLPCLLAKSQPKLFAREGFYRWALVAELRPFCLAPVGRLGSTNKRMALWSCVYRCLFLGRSLPNSEGQIWLPMAIFPTTWDVANSLITCVQIGASPGLQSKHVCSCVLFTGTSADSLLKDNITFQSLSGPSFFQLTPLPALWKKKKGNTNVLLGACGPTPPNILNRAPSLGIFGGSSYRMNMMCHADKCGRLWFVIWQPSPDLGPGLRCSHYAM